MAESFIASQATTSYKGAILQEQRSVPNNVEEFVYSYEDLIRNTAIDETALEVATETLDKGNQVMTENIYEAMDFFRNAKEAYQDFGYLNEYSYKNVTDLVSSCFRFEGIPDDDDEEESIFEEEELAS